MVNMVRIRNLKKDAPFVKVPLRRGSKKSWTAIPKGNLIQVPEAWIQDSDKRPFREIIDYHEVNKWIKVTRIQGSGKLVLGHYRKPKAAPEPEPAIAEVAEKAAEEAAALMEEAPPLPPKDEVDELLAKMEEDAKEEKEELEKEEVPLFTKEDLQELSYKELGILCSDRDIKLSRSTDGRIKSLLKWQKALLKKQKK